MLDTLSFVFQKNVTTLIKRSLGKIMEQIKKTIIRPYAGRKKRLIIIINRYAFLSFLALPIIAGLETYYQNKYGDADTTYIMGFWTWVYGISWFIAFSIRRKSLNAFGAHLKNQGGNIEESVSFSDDGIDLDVKGYFTGHYAWTSLTSIKNTKRHIQFTVAGIEVMLPKDNFSPQEIDGIKMLLTEKANQRLHSIAGSRRRYSFGGHAARSE